MNKILFPTFLLLLSTLAHAAKEMDAPSAPVETVSMVYVVIFGILFVGMIVGFFIYLWMTDKSETKDK
jgi:formate-dependent nitrite reductase membrane component NrfD